MLNFQTAKIVIIIKLSVKTLYFVWYITLAYANKKIRLDKFSKARTNTFQREMVKTDLTLRNIPNLKNVNHYTGDPYKGSPAGGPTRGDPAYFIGFIKHPYLLVNRAYLLNYHIVYNYNI